MRTAMWEERRKKKREISFQLFITTKTKTRLETPALNMKVRGTKLNKNHPLIDVRN